MNSLNVYNFNRTSQSPEAILTNLSDFHFIHEYLSAYYRVFNLVYFLTECLRRVRFQLSGACVVMQYQSACDSMVHFSSDCYSWLL